MKESKLNWEVGGDSESWGWWLLAALVEASVFNCLDHPCETTCMSLATCNERNATRVLAAQRMPRLRVLILFFFYFSWNKRNGVKLFLLVSWFLIHANLSPHRLFSSTLAHDMPPLTRSCALQDFLGQTFCTLGEIVGSPASRLEKPLGWVEMSDSQAPAYIPVQRQE